MKRRVSENHGTVQTSTTKNQLPPRRHSTCVNVDQQKDANLIKDVSHVGSSTSTSESIDEIPHNISETSKTKNVVIKKESRHVSFSNSIDVINPDEKAKAMKIVAIEKKANPVVKSAVNIDHSNKIEEPNKDEIINNKCKWGLNNFFKLGQNSEKPKVTITASKITKGQRRVSRINSVQNNQHISSECPRSKSNLTLEEYLQQKQSKPLESSTNDLGLTEHCDNGNANQPTKESSDKSTIERSYSQTKENSKYSSIQDYITKQNPRKESVASVPHVKNNKDHAHKAKPVGYSTKHRGIQDMKHKKHHQHGTKEIKFRPVQDIPNCKPHQVVPSNKYHQREKMAAATPDKMSLVKNTLLDKHVSKDSPCGDISGKTSSDHYTNGLKDISLPKGISLTVKPQDETHIRSVNSSKTPAKCDGQEKTNVNSVNSSNTGTKSGNQEKAHLNSVTISKSITKSVIHNSVNSSNIVKSTTHINSPTSFKNLSVTRNNSGIDSNDIPKSIGQVRRLSNSVISSNSVTKPVIQENHHISPNNVPKSVTQEKHHINSVTISNSVTKPVNHEKSPVSLIKERRSSNSQLVVLKGESKIITSTKIQAPMKSKLDDKETEHIPNKKPKLSHITNKLPIIQPSELPKHTRSHEVKTKPHLEKIESQTKTDDSKFPKEEKSNLKPVGCNSKKGSNPDKVMFEVSKNVTIEHLENTVVERPVSPKKEEDTNGEINQPTETPGVPNMPELNEPLPETNNANHETTITNELIPKTKLATNTIGHLSETASVNTSGQTKACNKSSGEMETCVPEKSLLNLVEPKDENDDSFDILPSEPKGTVEESIPSERPIENVILQSETSQAITSENELTDKMHEALESQVSTASEHSAIKSKERLPTSEIEPIDQALLTKTQLEYEKHRLEELANCPTLRSILSPSSKESPSPPLSLRILTPQEIARKFSNETDSLEEVSVNNQINPCQIENNQPTSEIISPDGHFLPSAVNLSTIAKNSLVSTTNGSHPNQALPTPSNIRPMLPKPSFNVDKHPAYQSMPPQTRAILGRPGDGVHFNHTLETSSNLVLNRVNPVDSSGIHRMLGEPSINTLARPPILPKPSFNVGTHPALHDIPYDAPEIVGISAESSVRSKPTSSANTNPTSSNAKPKKTTKRRKSKIDLVIDSVIHGQASVINGQSNVQLPYSSNPVQGSNHWNLESRQTRSSSADEYISLEQWEGWNQKTANLNNPRNYLQSYAEFLKSRPNENGQGIEQCRGNQSYYRYPNTADGNLHNGQLNQQNGQSPPDMNSFNPNLQIGNQNAVHQSAQRNQNIAPIQYNQQVPMRTANGQTNTWYPTNYQNSQNEPISLVTHGKNVNVGVPQPRSLPSQVHSSYQNPSAGNVQFARYPATQGISNIPTASIGNGQKSGASQNKSSVSNSTPLYTNRSIGQERSQPSSVRYSNTNPNPILPSHPYFPYQNHLTQPILNGNPHLNQAGMYNGNPTLIQNTNSNPQLNGTYQTYNSIDSYQNNHVHTNIATTNNQVPAFNGGAYENTPARMIDYNRCLSNTQSNVSQNNSNEMLSNNNPVSLPHSNSSPLENNPSGYPTEEALSSYQHTNYPGATLTQELVSAFHQRRYGDSQFVQQASPKGALYCNGNKSNSQIRTLLNNQTTKSRISSHHQSSNFGNHETLPEVSHQQATSEFLKNNGQIRGEHHTDFSSVQTYLRDYVRELSCPRQPLSQDDPNGHLLQNTTQPNTVPIQNHTLPNQNHKKKQQTDRHATANGGELAVPHGQNTKNSSSKKSVPYRRKSMGKEAWVLEYLRQNSSKQFDEPPKEQTSSPEKSPQNTATLPTTKTSYGIRTSPESLVPTPVEIPINDTHLDSNCNNLDDDNDHRESNPSRESQCSNYENILSDIVRETLVATTPSPCQTQAGASRTTPSPGKTKARRSSKSHHNRLEEESQLVDKQARFEEPIPSKGGQNLPSRAITPSPSKTQARRASQTKRKSTEDKSPHADREACSKRGDKSPASKRQVSLDTDDDGKIEIVHEKNQRSMSKDSGYSEAASVICYTGESRTKSENDSSEDSDMSGVETITIDDDKSNELDSERTLLNNLIKSRNFVDRWKNSWSEDSIPPVFDCQVLLTPITIKDQKLDSIGKSKEKVGIEKISVASKAIIDDETGELINEDSNHNGENLETSRDKLKKNIPVPKKSSSTLQNKHPSQNHSKESLHDNSKHVIPAPKKSPTLNKECSPTRDSTPTQAKALTGFVLKANTTNPKNKFYNMYNPCFLVLNQLRQCQNLSEQDNNTMNSCVLAIASIVNEMFVLKLEQNFNIDSPCFKRIVSGYAKTSKVQLILILSYYQDDVYRKLHEHIEHTDGYVIGKHEDVKACLLELIWLSRNIDLDAAQQGELIKYINLYRKLGTL
uniref:Uncharacterized protein n=1 Tax=Cacopsylla melanoneura TaxID=428564 RepID=A0A8D9ENQ0_9HEMI